MSESLPVRRYEQRLLQLQDHEHRVADLHEIKMQKDEISELMAQLSNSTTANKRIQ